VWLGGDDFDASVLDLSRWTFDGSSLPNSSSNLIKTSSDITFLSTSGIGEQYGVLFWKEKLPLDSDWSATIHASISPLYQPSSPGGYVEALISVIQDMNTFSNYFTQTLHRNIFTSVSTDWAIAGQSSFTAVPASFDSGLLRINYRSMDKTLTALYAEDANPSNFTISKKIAIDSWTNGGDLNLAIGGYSFNSTITSGLLTLDNITIVPEPSSLSLLAIGLGVLFRRSRKRD